MIQHFLLYGGTGNLSYTVAKNLKTKGYNVTCITRGNKRTLEASLMKLDISILHYSELDVKIFSDLKPDYIVDFAAYSPKDVESHIFPFLECKLKRYIFISTTAFYKRHKRYRGNHTESDACQHHPWDYAYSKYQAELHLEALSEGYNIDALSLRLGHTLGTMVPVYLGNPGAAFIDHVMETGDIPICGNICQPWSIGSADGVARLLDKIAVENHTMSRYEAIHFSEYLTSWEEIITIFASIVKPSAKIYELPVKKVNSICPEWLPSILYHKQYADKYDLSRLQSLIGHEPDINLYQILYNSVAFTRGQKDSAKYPGDRSKLRRLCDPNHV